ncbi:MAG TPA: NUDIX hydrolase [Anaerovoracaceae bacterium]|nr:NUDIX hydrolase [Anaerovoracaceae bacterium]
MTFEEKTISSEMIYEGHILNLRKDKVTVINGTSVREVIEHNGGAVLAAVTEDGKMIMVEQFRKPLERVVLEVPAGKIDPGEEPLETAKRELKEETGYTADNVEFLTRIYPSVGYSEEALYLYLCTGLTPGETDFDDNEALDIKAYDLDQLVDMVMSGKIQDAKSAVAILMVKRLQEGVQPL